MAVGVGNASSYRVTLVDVAVLTSPISSPAWFNSRPCLLGAGDNVPAQFTVAPVIVRLANGDESPLLVTAVAVRRGGMEVCKMSSMNVVFFVTVCDSSLDVSSLPTIFSVDIPFSALLDMSSIIPENTVSLMAYPPV